MPQMSPLFWFILYLYFSLLFLGFNIMIYYLISYLGKIINKLNKISFMMNLWW